VHLIVVVLSVWGGKLLSEGCDFVLQGLNSVHEVLFVIFELVVLFLQSFELPVQLFNGLTLPFGLDGAFLFM
jgi:hypothetical protein